MTSIGDQLEGTTDEFKPMPTDGDICQDSFF